MKNPQTLMVQGTTSDAGKSVLVAAIGRILARRGHSVAPFKPQNMALNSAVTSEGGEIGRAQAVQAAACYLAPSVLMNPVLLKPNSDVGAQVIVRGRAVGNMDAGDYHGNKPNLLGDVLASYEELKALHENIIVEGAGSPAEINLRDRDIANMGFAEVADCPVIIVADIDRGGVFAHLVGTYELLSDTEKQRIKGFVINRFRGDIALLRPGLDWLEKRCGVPVLGVIPYIQDLYIEAEDAIDVRQKHFANDAIKVVIPVYPRASNHTDFDVLRLHPKVNLEYQRNPEKFSGADLIILPGSKSVRDDLAWLRESGWEKLVEKHLRFGGKLIGICGGFQMLGEKIHDPHGIESTPGSSTGLGLLAMETTLAEEKTLRNVEGFSHIDKRVKVEGYEIHAGCSDGKALKKPWFVMSATGRPERVFDDGALADDDQVRGSYIHGLFDRAGVLDEVLRWCGLHDAGSLDYAVFRDNQLDYLADCVENEIAYQSWCRLLSVEPGV